MISRVKSSTGQRLPAPTFFRFFALSPAPVRVPAVIAHQLKRFLRNMLGDGGNEFLGGKDLEVFPTALALGRHLLRSVDHHAGCIIISDLLYRKRIADDVLGQGLLAHLVVTGQSHPVVQGESGIVPPGQKLANQLIINQFLLF